MKKVSLFTALLVGILLTACFQTPVSAQEKEAGEEVKTKVSEVCLFKNGLAVITREFSFDVAGRYVVTDVPDPVHGTFWVESEELDEVRVTTREVKAKPSSLSMLSMRDSLAGKKVTAHLREGSVASGTVLSLTEDGAAPDWNRRYENNYPYWYYNSNSYSRWNSQPPQPASDLIALETGKGLEFIRLSEVTRIEVEGGNGDIELTTKKPVLIFKLTKPEKEHSIVRISYLAKGLTWAPAYRINMTDDTNAVIEQHAVIKNELESFEDAKVYLVSGFPSMRFSHVESPLSPNTSLSTFFSQLAQQVRGGNAGVTGQAVMSNVSQPRNDLPQSELTSGGDIDLHYQYIGKRTMAEGDSLYVRVAKKKVKYERIIEYIIPDRRNEHGQYYNNYEVERDPERFQDNLWDSIRFKNPFDFPMTTAPAAIYNRGRFSGQQISYWTDPGETAVVPVTKALSVRSTHGEQELPDSRGTTYILGKRFRQVAVQGTVIVGNHRKSKVTMVIRRRFSGELLESEGNPVETLLKEGVYSVNKRNELTWTVPLGPGESVTLKYTYLVYVYWP
jgi:hypothetical protein